MLRAAIFDLDGTLVDSVDAHARAWAEAFASHGVPVPEPDCRFQIGKGGDNLLPVFLDERARAEHGEAIEKTHGEIFRSRFRAGVRAFPAVRELFEALAARDVRVALASSSKPEDLEHYTRMLGIEDLLHTATHSGHAERSKPHPDIFEAAQERLHPIPVDESLGFGDSPWDAQAAGGMGLPLVGLRCGGFAEHDLLAAGAIRIYQDPADLLAHLDEIMALR
ncbi:MAG: HAD family phosphatase [Gluconacetobacter diazotrophicus]|nr:HAD family phosphatase [Gluconacetobacter diazotrophicus]